MKLCYMYDDAFIPLRDNFLASIKDDFELISLVLNKPKFSSNPNMSDLYGGGIDVWLEKPKYLLRIMDRCKPNEYFIYSDIDIVFFKPIISTIKNILGDKDILFLREIPAGLVPWQGGEGVPGNCNFGFCIIKSCDKTRKFFQDVLSVIETTKLMDQTVVNKILFGDPTYDLNWGVLPLEFTTTSFIHNNQVNNKSLMFHAICCVDQQEKLNLLRQATDLANLCIA